MDAFHEAMQQWRALLGPEAVRESGELDRYRANCLSLTREIPAALLPESEAQVIELVRIANRYLIPLYPFSTGHNWGYGTSLPPAGGCVIVDLSRMNRIVDMDPELGLITLEPGVTQRQLFDYLSERGLDFFVPTTGAGPTASIIGNALERGFGMTPEKDHFTAVHSVRAVLADGTVYQPFMSEIGSPVSDGVYKWGIGPYVDGLFTQGNFGIVTAMQISLVRRAENTEVFAFTVKDQERFYRLVEDCREMATDLRGPIGSMKFINQKQLEATMGTTKLGAGLDADFAWIGFGVIHCKHSMARALRREVRRAIGGQVSRLIFMNDRRLKKLRAVRSWLPGRLGAALDGPIGRFQEILNIINGVPRGLELRLAYQHVPFDPTKQPLDPARDGVGLLWYAPVIPLKRDMVQAMMEMTDRTLSRYGFPQSMSMTTLSEKCGIGVIPVVYKRPEQAEHAYDCFRELWMEGARLGCYPYRINIAAMPELTGTTDSPYWKTVAALKAAVDPNGILAPGRYNRADIGVADLGAKTEPLARTA